MRRFIGFVIAVIASGAFARAVEADQRHAGPDHLAQMAALREALAALDHAIADLGPVRSGAARRALEDLRVARARTEEALRIAELALPPRHPHAPAPEPPDRMLPKAAGPMDDAAFGALLARMREVAFGGERLALLGDAARGQRFTCAQVRQVVGLFDFGSEQVEAAAMLYPRVVDRSRFFEVIADLKFEGDREALRARVAEWDRAGLQAPPGGGRP